MSTAEFQNHVAVVTGAASGIGCAVAKRFAEQGAAVALLDRDEEKGRTVAQEMEAAGGSCQFFPLDVTEEAAVHSTIERIVARFQGIDHLVNNAGINQVKGIEDCEVRDWDRVFDVNVKSIFLLVKHTLPALRRSSNASVVNIGSVSSLVAQTGTPAYVASKGAVLMLSKALALDLAGDGIRVNCVCPGITDTPMLRRHLHSTGDPDRTMRQRIRRVPLTRMLSPDEIADAVLYLASGRASGITGTELVVDGGYLAAAEGPAD